jgi:hypothetical protein
MLMLSEAVFVEAVELPLALVMPVQPEEIKADTKSVHVRNRTNTRGMESAREWIER